MRASLLVVLIVAGCQPDVAYDTYLCGDEAACPPGQACNGPDNHCVSLADVQPFACAPSVEHDDNTPATATPIPGLACASMLATIPGCLADHDPEDYFTFTVPAECAAEVVHIHIAYPLSFEEVPFALTDASGTVLEEAAACDASQTSLAALGLVDKCLAHAVAPGATYFIHVTADPTLSCGGTCAFNRYTLTVRLASS